LTFTSGPEDWQALLADPVKPTDGEPMEFAEAQKQDVHQF
jgi:hypothetical protein